MAENGDVTNHQFHTNGQNRGNVGYFFLPSFVLYFSTRKSTPTPTRDLGLGREVSFCFGSALLGNFALVFMNTQKVNSNFHRPTWACRDRPSAPKQHTPTPVDGEFDALPLQHRDSRVWASNAKLSLFMNKQSQRHFSLLNCGG